MTDRDSTNGYGLEDIADARSRRKEALDKIVSVEHPRVLSFLRNKFAELGADFDDVAQDVWLAIWQNIGESRGFASIPEFRAWMFTIARNDANSRMRKRQRSKERLENPMTIADLIGAPNKEANADTRVSDDERAALVKGCCSKLSIDQQSILQLKIDGVAVSEIARRYDISADAASARLSRARKSVRDCFWKKMNASNE